jgi:hypothetical protein
MKKGKVMNLKFAVIPLGICLFGSALSMHTVTAYVFCSGPSKIHDVPYDAQFNNHDEPQQAAVRKFVNEVVSAWVLEAESVIGTESVRRTRGVAQRSMSEYGIAYSQDGHMYYTSIYQLDSNPSEYTYKKCLEAQLRMGILDLELLERVNRPGESWAFGQRVFIPTPKKMIELLPDLIETLGLTVYPENYVEWYNSRQETL